MLFTMMEKQRTKYQSSDKGSTWKYIGQVEIKRLKCLIKCVKKYLNNIKHAWYYNYSKKEL